MDGQSSGSNGSSASKDHNLVYAKNFKQQLANEIEVMAQIGAPYREEAQRQISQALPEGQIPAYMRTMGLTRERLLHQGAGLVSTIAGVNKHNLEQHQVQAIAENILSNGKDMALLNWGLFAGTMFMAYRHRRRIPKGLQARVPSLMKWVWPPTLFFVYLIPVSLFVQPVVLGVNSRVHVKRLAMDPRFDGLDLKTKEKVDQIIAKRQHEQYNHGDQHSQKTHSEPSIREQAAPALKQQAKTTQSQRGWNSQRQDDASPTATPISSWGSDAQSQSNSTHQSDSEPQPSHSWDDDDASPIAPSYQPTPSSNSGSSWDRLRQQSAPTRQRTQPRGGWGSDSESHSPSEHHCSDDNDSYSAEETERTRERNAAQKEFDQMIEQDGRSSDQGRDAWGRR